MPLIITHETLATHDTINESHPSARRHGRDLCKAATEIARANKFNQPHPSKSTYHHRSQPDVHQAPKPGRLTKYSKKTSSKWKHQKGGRAPKPGRITKYSKKTSNKWKHHKGGRKQRVLTRATPMANNQNRQSDLPPSRMGYAVANRRGANSLPPGDCQTRR